MTRIIVLTLLLFSCSALGAQEFQWANKVGSALGSDEVSVLVPSDKDSIIAAGVFAGTLPGGTGSANGGNDVFVRGNLSNGSNAFGSLHFSSTGAQDAVSAGVFDDDYTIITGKLDGNTSVAQNVGNITNAYGSGSFFLSKINKSGKADWMVPDTNFRQSEGKAIAVDGSGNIYVTGTYRDSLVIGSNKIIASGLNDIFVAKFNSLGVVQWLTKVGGSGDDQVASLIYDDVNSRLLLCGNYSRSLSFSPSGSLAPNTVGKYAVFLAAFNPTTGNSTAQERVFYSAGDAIARDMVLLSTGSLAIGGGFTTSITNQASSTLSSAGGEDIFIGTINTNLTTAINMKRYGGVLSERITNLEAATNLFAFGEFSTSSLSIGAYSASTNSSQDVFLAAWNNGLNEFAAHGGLMTLSSDIMSASSMKLSGGQMYFSGQFRRRANFGKVGTFNSNSVSFFDGYIAAAKAKDVFCPIDDSVSLATNFRVQGDSAILCYLDSGLMTSLATNTLSFNWYDSIAPAVSIGTGQALNVGKSGTYYAEIEDLSKSCKDTSISIKVVMEDEPFNQINDTTICEGTTAFTMPMSPNYSFINGSLTGSNGIDPTTGRFFSAIAGIGTDTIVYTYTDPNGCNGMDTAIYTVQAKPVINFSTLPRYCRGDEKDSLTFATTVAPTRITYYEMTTPWGIQDSVIFRCDSLPANAVPGHVVTFHAIDSIGCSSSRNANLVVNPTPNVVFNFSTPIPFCKNTRPFTLSGGNQTGGIYSGTGVNSTTGIFSPANSFGLSDTLTFSYTDNNGCKDSASVPVSLDTVPLVSFMDTTRICSDDSLVELNTGMPNQGGNGAYISPWVSSGNFYPRLAGVGTHPVTYRFQDLNGCSDSTVANIKVNSLPGVSLAAIAPICENDNPIRVAGGIPTGGIYRFRGQVLQNDTLNPADFPALPGGSQDSLSYQYTDTNNCSALASTTLIIRRLDGLVFNPDLNLNRLCNNDSIDLFAMGDTLFSPPPATGGRFLDANGNVISIFKGSDYLPLGADTSTLSRLQYIYDYASTGCSDTATRFINIAFSPRVSIKPVRPACEGIPLSLEGEGGITYLWDNDSIQNPRIVFQDSAQKYFVTATNINGCKDSASVLVGMSDGSIIDGNDITETLKKGSEVTLDILDAYSSDTIDLIGTINLLNEPENSAEYLNEEGFKEGVLSSIYYKPTPEFRRQDTINYEVCDIVCTNICDTAAVVFNVLGDPYDFIPNGFSPNGDGLNDKWVVPGIEAYPENELYIYNRWGDLIFEAAPYENEWEGQANKGIGGSEKVGDGIFYYVLITNGGEPIKGSIEMKSK